jgi:hypothetical protein
MKKFTDKINESVEDKMRTAEELLDEYRMSSSDYLALDTDYSTEDIIHLMIEFAKYHVKNAVKEQIRIENDRISDESELDRLTEEALKRTYPLENIK